MERVSLPRIMASTSIRQRRKGASLRGRKTASLGSRQRGFALVAALIAGLLLLAMGMLVIQISTQDLKSGASTVGGKKALAAVDTGIHNLLSNYDPAATSTTLFNQWYSIDGGADANSRYRISTPAASRQAPVPLPGYSMEAGQGWGMTRSDVRVDGQSTSYNTSMAVDVGMGYGPVPTGTLYR
jgi:Tfp pilus assembly protein PilV